jgi:hypothetical protein
MFIRNIFINYKLILYLDCWNTEPDDRPSIDQVVAKLNAIISKEKIQLSSEQQNIVEIPRNIINNSLHGEMSQLIQNFTNMNTGVVETSISSEYNFDMVVNEIILLLENIGMGLRKYGIVNYLHNHNTTLQGIYNWLLNNQNNSNSVFLLGVFYHFGIEINVDLQKAFELYRNAADSDNAPGIISLGYCYQKGIGTSIDYQNAFKLYQKAANLGNARGIHNLGLCYHFGIGTSIDKQKAFELYQKSTNLGNTFGINGLGRCYSEGIGTSIDYQKAFELLYKAAILGNYAAQYNLAVMYEYGKGVKKDTNQAIYWYKKSAEQGNQDAQNNLNNLIN